MASAAQKTIGGRVFSFGILPATKAVRVEIAIARVIGEPLFKAFTEMKGEGDVKPSEDKQTAALGAAIALLTSKMEPDELLATMATVFEFCSCDGKRIEIDTTFTGRNAELWQVFVEALKVNFSDFFHAGLSASLASVMPQA